MGGTKRQFNNLYQEFKKKFKKPLHKIHDLMPPNFTDDQFVKEFQECYPNLWEELNQQYKFWKAKNDVLVKYGKKSRYNFRKPYNFILDCSYHLRKNRKSPKMVLPTFEIDAIKQELIQANTKKLISKRNKQELGLKYLQEIHPSYADYFIDRYFQTHNLHEKLEVMRELSKFYSKKIHTFFLKVNHKRNFHLKMEAMKYVQGIKEPFVLTRKKKGKKNFIDNEIVKNPENPDALLRRIFVADLEAKKEFDVFISHSSRDHEEIVKFYKQLNSHGLVCYVDWVNDKYDLKREWVNKSTPEILKKRLEQSKILIYFYSDNGEQSVWVPWEIGMFDILRNKVCIFGLKREEKQYPEYLDLYPDLIFENNHFYVLENGSKITINDWITRK